MYEGVPFWMFLALVHRIVSYYGWRPLTLWLRTIQIMTQQILYIVCTCESVCVPSVYWHFHVHIIVSMSFHAGMRGVRYHWSFWFITEQTSLLTSFESANIQKQSCPSEIGLLPLLFLWKHTETEPGLCFLLRLHFYGANVMVSHNVVH